MSLTELEAFQKIENATTEEELDAIVAEHGAWQSVAYRARTRRMEIRELHEPIHGDDLPRPDDEPDVPMPGDRW